MRDRVQLLTSSFTRYVQEFENQKLFTGPSLYFHRKTMAILRSHACSVRKCLEDPAFLDSLYATLTSWGLHRMGRKGAKLVDLPEMVWSLRRRAHDLAKLEGLRLWELDQPAMERVRECLWYVVDDLEVSAARIKIVAGSKALHHLLPNLLPPIDRQYTVRFFLDNKNAIQGREAEAFAVMYPEFWRIAVECVEEIQSLPRADWNTSVTKVIDNAIVGFGRMELAIKGDDDA